MPDWIYQHPGYARLNPGQRFALHALAWRADKPDADGNLIGAFTGEKIRALIGCKRSAFWEWVSDFERFGFVVVISRGGGRLGDVVGIPGQPHALDSRRVDRRTTPNGKGGAKPALYRKSASVRNADTNASVRNADGTRPPNGHHPSVIRTPPVRNTDTTIPIDHLSKPSPSPSAAEIGGGDGESQTNAHPNPGLTAFWRAYPAHRRSDPPAVQAEWNKQGLEKMAQVVMSGLDRARQSLQWTKDKGQYVDDMLKFLQRGKWEYVAPESSGGYADLSGNSRPLTAEDERMLWGDDDDDRPAPPPPPPPTPPTPPPAYSVLTDPSVPF